VAALDTPAGLTARHGPPPTVTFTLEDGDAAVLTAVGAVEGVDRVERTDRRVTVTGHGPLLARVAAALVDRGIAPLDLTVRRGTLEDAYFALVDGHRGERGESS
jgi:ABC-2 type transport system ATP-binding protein